MASNALDSRIDSPSLPVVGPGLCTICSSHETTTEQSLCEMCQQWMILQFIADDPADLKVSIWHCPRCTLINKISNERCEACGHSELGSVGLLFYISSHKKSFSFSFRNTRKMFWLIKQRLRYQRLCH
jgi:hypothetical protein